MVYKIKNYKNETKTNDMDSFFLIFSMILNFDNFFKNFSFLENRIFKDEDDYKITNFFYNCFLFSMGALIYSRNNINFNFLYVFLPELIYQNFVYDDYEETESINIFNKNFLFYLFGVLILYLLLKNNIIFNKHKGFFILRSTSCFNGAFLLKIGNCDFVKNLIF